MEGFRAQSTPPPVQVCSGQATQTNHLIQRLVQLSFSRRFLMDQQKKVAFININPCPALPAKTFNRVKKCEVALMVFRGKSAVVLVCGVKWSIKWAVAWCFDVVHTVTGSTLPPCGCHDDTRLPLSLLSSISRQRTQLMLLYYILLLSNNWTR